MAKQDSPHGYLDSWEYSIGDIVYLKIRDERLRGMITAITLRPASVTFEVTWPTSASWHYAFELSPEFEPDYEAASSRENES